MVQPSRAARHGPVVLLTSDSQCGHAVIPIACAVPIVHISLPGLSDTKAEELLTMLVHLRAVLIPRSRSERGFTFPLRERLDHESGVHLLLEQLWELIARPVVVALALRCVSLAPLLIDTLSLMLKIGRQSGLPTTHLVVPDRLAYVSSHSRHGKLRDRGAGVEAIRLCGIILLAHSCNFARENTIKR